MNNKLKQKGFCAQVRDSKLGLVIETLSDFVVFHVQSSVQTFITQTLGIFIIIVIILERT